MCVVELAIQVYDYKSATSQPVRVGDVSIGRVIRAIYASSASVQCMYVVCSMESYTINSLG